MFNKPTGEVLLTPCYYVHDLFHDGVLRHVSQTGFAQQQNNRIRAVAATNVRPRPARTSISRRDRRRNWRITP